MLVVGDVHEMFMPLLDGFLCTPEESDLVIDALMQQIPEMFANTRETETILLPAILAGMEALKVNYTPFYVCIILNHTNAVNLYFSDDSLSILKYFK